MENQYTYYTPDQDDQNQNGQGGYQYQPQDEKPPKKENITLGKSSMFRTGIWCGSKCGFSDK